MYLKQNNFVNIEEIYLFLLILFIHKNSMEEFNIRKNIAKPLLLKGMYKKYSSSLSKFLYTES